MCAEAGVVQRGADGGDAAVHHVGRGDDVGAGLGVGDGGAGEQRQRGVVVDLAGRRDDAAVAVRGVLAEADVGDDDEAGGGAASASRTARWTMPSGA